MTLKMTFDLKMTFKHQIDLEYWLLALKTMGKMAFHKAVIGIHFSGWRPYWILRKQATGGRAQFVCDDFWKPYVHIYHHAKLQKKLVTKCTVILNSLWAIPWMSSTITEYSRFAGKDYCLLSDLCCGVSAFRSLWPARGFLLANFYSSGPFTCILSKTSLECFLC